LINKFGDIIDQNGKEIFKREHLNVDGEPPKIFGFTKFNTERIKGNFEIDKRGNPILKKGKKKGELFDSDGNRVN